MSRKYKIALALASALLGLYYILFENKAEIGLLLIVLSRFDSLDIDLDDKFKK